MARPGFRTTRPTTASRCCRPPGLKHPDDKGHTTGIHHTAFEFATFDQWLDNYIRLRDHGILPG